MKKRNLGFPLAETGDPVKPMRVSVKSEITSTNKVNGKKGKYKSKSKTSSLFQNLDGSGTSYMETQNKVKGMKGRYKSKSIAVSKEDDGSYRLSKVKGRGEMGRHSKRKISERAFNRKSEALKRKHNKR